MIEVVFGVVTILTFAAVLIWGYWPHFVSWIDEYTVDRTCREEVFDALDNALDNGYGEWLTETPINDIVNNMIEHDDNFAAWSRDRLIKHVAAWRRRYWFRINSPYA